MRPPLWQHQREDLEASWQLPGAAIHWEPRLGKTRFTIETAHRLWRAGKIDAVLVFAPAGVHLEWTREQLPRHWPEGFEPSARPFIVEWNSAKATGRAYQEHLTASLKVSHLLWVAANIEGLVSTNLTSYLRRLVKRRRVLLIVDESHLIKNPKAKRTREVKKLAALCPYRRNLTGTPSGQGPFDLWAQYDVVDEGRLGYEFSTFRERYGVFKKNRSVKCTKCGVPDDYEQRWRGGKERFTRCRRCGHEQPVFGPLFDDVVGYRRLDELRERIRPITFERKKKDCLDLPPRLMKTLTDGTMSEVLGVPRYFQLPIEHARVYRELRDELLAELRDGQLVTARNPLVNLLRLQQVTRGFIDTDRGLRALGEPYPAIEALRSLLEEHPGKAIVWCHFRPDVEAIAPVLRDLYGPDAVAVCYGGTPASERVALRTRFRDDANLRVWLGTPQTGGIGVDLGAADLMVFYSHSYSYLQRVQALERNYGSTQNAERIAVVDLVAADTVDLRALDAIARKDDLAASVSVRQYRDLLIDVP